MASFEDQTLAGIALSNHAYIPVFEKYSLDFCCRGNKTLAEACAEKNLSATEIAMEMTQLTTKSKPVLPFTEMDAEQLIAYILIHHHFYVKNTMPVIMSHIEKVYTKHGEKYPHMENIFLLFKEVMAELLPHMEKEEKILFPRIKEIAGIQNKQQLSMMAPGFLNAPIHMMEAEHDKAGQLLFEIRKLSNHYTPPASACTTHRICLEELKAFEEDLHQHVHLENNILFPLAMKMVHE